MSVGFLFSHILVYVSKFIFRFVEIKFESCYNEFEKHIEMLKSFGVEEKYIVCKGQACYLLEIFFQRRKEGLCSYKQAKMLLRYKVENLDILDGDTAKYAMNLLSKNKWKPTKEFWDLFKE